jgi:hypothetical protein
MILAPPGLSARYKHDNPKHHSSIAIVAFDDDGHPLVIDEDGRRDKTRLIRADAYGNYDGMAEDPHPPITALLPAGGWRAEFTDDDGVTWSMPLVGWGLKGGAVVPLTTDTDGMVEDFDHYGGKYRIYHPDATEPPEQSV